VLPVEIIPIQDNLVLRARGSELLILSHHVEQLKSLKKPQEFSQYFTGEALINRPARKLFEAWLRKDQSLWPRIYKTIHTEMNGKDGDESGTPEVKAKTVGTPAKADKEKKAAVEPSPKAEKPAKTAEPKKLATEDKKAADTKAKTSKPAEKIEKKEAKDTKVAKAKDKPTEKPAAKAAKSDDKKKTEKSAKPAAKAKAPEKKSDKKADSKKTTGKAKPAKKKG
jgi:hypothetical protein